MTPSGVWKKTPRGVLHKRCGRCKKWKPADSDHYAQTTVRHEPHFASWCKTCVAEYGRQKYHEKKGNGNGKINIDELEKPVPPPNKMAWMPRCCKRCGGDLYRVPSRSDWHCLQCGWEAPGPAEIKLLMRII